MILRLRTVAMVAAPVLLIGGGIWLFASGSNHETVGAGGLPLIKADTRPVKLPPEEPGGEIMPNADSTVFTAMGAGEAADPSMENLRLPELPKSEPPPVTADFAGLKTGFTLPTAAPERDVDNLLAGATEETAPALQAGAAPEALSSRYASGIEPEALNATAGATPDPVPAPETESPAPMAETPAPKTPAEKPDETPVAAPEEKTAEDPAPVKVAKPLSKPLAQPKQVVIEKQTPAQTPRAPVTETPPAIKAETAKTAAPVTAAPALDPDAPYRPQPKTPAATPAAPAPATSTPGGDNHYIQLSSMPAGGDTARMWAQLRSMYPEALQGLSPSYQEATVPGKGAYVRIQAGPLTQAQAAERCRVLRTLDPKAGCLVVRR